MLAKPIQLVEMKEKEEETSEDETNEIVHMFTQKPKARVLTCMLQCIHNYSR